MWAKFRQAASEKREKIWQSLLQHDPRQWKQVYNENLRNSKIPLDDDPVPKAVLKVLPKISLESFSKALEKMPVRAAKDKERLSQRIGIARLALKKEEAKLWKRIIATARWSSPLLIMDEAHHLKNPKTLLARQLQCADSTEDLRTGDGALSRSFHRMLFLTATPFQLGHNELVRVLRRFSDVFWNHDVFGEKETFTETLDTLLDYLSAAQLSSIRLFRAWSQLREEDFLSSSSVSGWWKQLVDSDSIEVSLRRRIFKEAVEESRSKRELAEKYLRPWVIRHNKGDYWPDTTVVRRERLEGAKILEHDLRGGLDISDEQLMPFFLAARGEAESGKDVLGEALSSSYEAFRFTRSEKRQGKDDVIEEDAGDVTQANWFMEEFDRSVEKMSGRIHPKMNATVRRVVDLWELGEKIIVFAFYRQTCRYLRIHISAEMERRIQITARRRLAGSGMKADDEDIDEIVSRIQDRYFDSVKGRGRKAIDRALTNIVEPYRNHLESYEVDIETVKGIMRRFLRVKTTLVRAFPIHRFNQQVPRDAVRSMLDTQDKSGVSWREKFVSFLEFLVHECSSKERVDYIDSANKTQTGRIRVQRGEIASDVGDREASDIVMTLANIQVATGETADNTRSRLMLAFNTPFFPDILVCSRVMGEGVDLHRYCRHVIHHDLDWNPSDIEQRTGRVDRIGCKAQGRHPIPVYLPYISGTADERQYNVMTEREKWFRIVMGQEEVAKLIPTHCDGNRCLPPTEFERTMIFDLSVW